MSIEETTTDPATTTAAFKTDPTEQDRLSGLIFKDLCEYTTARIVAETAQNATAAQNQLWLKSAPMLLRFHDVRRIT